MNVVRGRWVRSLLSLAAVGGLLALVQPARGQTNDFTNGQAATVAIGQADLNSTTAATTASGLDLPEDVSIDTVRRLIYVIDTGNNRVLRYDLDEALAGNPTAQAVFGQANMTSAANPSPPTAASLNEPFGVVIDPVNDVLYVADNGNNRVLRFDDASTATDGVSAALVLGQPDFVTVDNTASVTTTTAALSLALGVNGELWMADGARVLRWDSPLTAVNGAPADGVLGKPDFTTPNDLTTSAERIYGTVRSIAVSANGALYVADSQAHRVLRWDDAANKADGAAADAVLGQPDFTTRTSGVSATTMDRPEGLTLDANGRLYVSDKNNQRVLWFNNADTLSTGAAADGVLGHIDLDGTAATGTDRTFFSPRRMDMSADNELWIADRTNNRVLLFTYEAAEEPTPTPVDGEEGAQVDAACEQLPDMAVSPQFISFDAAGQAQIEVALRNLCQDRPFNYADVLLSLSDGIVVTDVPAGWLNLGQRAAWQNLSLAPDETKRAVISVSAPNGVPAGPVHVTELYANGGVAKRIDGVFITPASAPAAGPAPVVGVPAAPEAPAPLPAALPNTGGPLLPLGGLAAVGAALLAAGAARRR